MGLIVGKITSKILRRFGTESSAYNPPADRNDSPRQGQAIPRQRVSGAQLSKPNRKKK
jgi:hypothetical protein